MSEIIPYIKLIRDSLESDFLQEKYPNAFLLLCQIAKRARRNSGHPDGLQIGESLIGDYKKAGISTRQQYRTALDILISRSHIKKIETCRTRKKSTNGTTTEGTKVILLSSDVWDINPESINHLVNHRPTTDQPPTNHEQERKRKNKNEKEEVEKINKKEKILPISANDELQESAVNQEFSHPIERRSNIQTSDEEHESLLKYIQTKKFIEPGKEAELLELAYDHLSEWKKGKSKKERESHSDSGRLRQWAIRALKEELLRDEELIARERKLKSYPNQGTNQNIQTDKVELLEKRKAYANNYITKDWYNFIPEKRPITKSEYVCFENDKLKYLDEKWDTLFPHYMQKSMKVEEINKNG